MIAIVETHRPRRSNGLHRLVFALLLAGAGMSVTFTGSAANSFSDKSYGLARCARAVLHHYKVEHVRVHGHHFHCFPLREFQAGRRAVLLSHNLRLRQDDQISYVFGVNSLGRYIAGSLNTSVHTRVNLPRITRRRLALFLGHPEFTFPWFEFKGAAKPGPPPTYNDFAERFSMLGRNVRRPDWQSSAKDILASVIAELGTPPRQDTDCDLPTFYENDNFTGRSFRLSVPQPDLKRITVGGAHMGDRISSLCLPRGWEASTFEHDHYKGTRRVFRGPVEFEDLERRNRLRWGDKISSIRVRQR